MDENHSNIVLCAFDYLAGTFSTAYKGPLTSLIISDFCIEKEKDKVTIKGKILALPQDGFELVLVSEGKTLTREKLSTEGSFRIRLELKVFDRTQHLQLDLIKKAKHIGTFLIKSKEQGPFIAATEVFEEVKGFNLRGLVRLVEEKIGLKAKAEELISYVLSPKKLWYEFAVKLYSFSKDLFWADRTAFREWLKFILKFMLLSIKNLPNQKKPVTDLENLISLIAEAQEPQLASQTLLFLSEYLKEQDVDLTVRGKQILKIILTLAKTSSLNSPYPAIHVIHKAQQRLEEFIPLSETFVHKFDNPHGLLRYTKQNVLKQLSLLNTLKDMVQKNSLQEAEELTDKLELTFVDYSEMIKDIFRSIKPERIDSAVVKEIVNFIEHSPHINDEAVEILAEEIAELFIEITKDKRLIADTLLHYLSNINEKTKNRVLFNQRLLQSIFSTGSNSTEKIFLEAISNTPVLGSGFKGYRQDTWEPIYDRSHIQRLRNTLKVIIMGGHKHKWFLYRTVANLYLIDLFVPDEAVLQKVVTEYLNTVPLHDAFSLHLLILKRLPVYYNEIGATGLIRQITTELDSWGNDPIIYFVRKQIHVNSGPHNIELLEAVLKSWAVNNKEILKDFIPSDIVDSVNQDYFKTISDATGLLIKELSITQISEIYRVEESNLKNVLDRLNIPEEFKQKLLLMFQLYIYLKDKYVGSHGKIHKRDFNQLINNMISLKKIFTAKTKSIPEESLYYKRHIAFGIPSVMGTYREEKFDALKEFLKMEDLLYLALEEQVSQISIEKDLNSFLDALRNFLKVFELYNIKMPLLKDTITMLSHNRLYLSQVLDVVKTLSKELIFIVENYYRWIMPYIEKMLKLIPRDSFSRELTKNIPDDSLVDIVVRNIISNQPALQEYDRFLNQSVRLLTERLQKEKDDFIKTTGISFSRQIFLLSKTSSEEAIISWPRIGSKAKNLILLYHKGLSVPEGIILPSEWTFSLPDNLKDIVKGAIRALEESTGREFGGEQKPLFVSVRSGSYISMPGILDSILFCGMNETTLKALSTEIGNSAAWDAFRRFLAHFLSVAHGVTLNNKEGEPKLLVKEYLHFAASKGIKIAFDPFEQLTECVKAVYKSWFTQKALNYRKTMNISEYWGTAVLIMPMVIVNTPEAGASVFFTRDPRSLEMVPFGETRLASTGDDIVLGTYINTPISAIQSNTVASLQETDPQLYNLHREIAKKVEQAMDGIPQEIELAYRKEDAEWKAYILQTRPMEFYRQRVDRFHEVCKMESNILTRGIGVHGGALSGIASFETDAQKLKKIKETQDIPIILFRRDTSTADVELMQYIDGLITSTGGVTSHASVLAKKFNLTAVVGCSELKIDIKSKKAMIGDFVIEEGTRISIDGTTGLVYKGTCFVFVKDTL